MGHVALKAQLSGLGGAGLFAPGEGSFPTRNCLRFNLKRVKRVAKLVT